MSNPAYSFLDVAIIDAVRERFAAGEALAILSQDLNEIIWANGPGSTLLGFAGVGIALGAPLSLPAIARRQIEATPGFPDIDRPRPLMTRLRSASAPAIPATAQSVTLPDGEPAILLAVAAGSPATRAQVDSAARAVSGFGGDGQFAALLGPEGKIEAATAGFEGLGIRDDALRTLIAASATSGARLAKQMLAGHPSGLARLTDDPARYLLVVIDERHAAPAAADSQHSHAPDPTRAAISEGAAAGAEEVPAADVPAPAVEPEMKPDRAIRPTGDETRQPAPQHHDEWYFREMADAGDGKAEADAGPADGVGTGTDAEQELPASTAAPDRLAAPLRFVWRTDAAGRFSQLSSEFADAFGKAADVIGRSFREVSMQFGLDPDEEIAGLLERRDTWSGRAVLWPVAGTDLRIPVDLAALPVYDRDREFQGFRGFGVARLADALVDPDATGLRIAPEGAGGDALPGDPATPADPFQGERPAIAITRMPERRHSDKVIRLAEHRAPGTERSLSPGERTAFREIGERLKQEIRPGKPGEPQSEPASAADVLEVDAHPVPAANATAETDAAPAEDTGGEAVAQDASAEPSAPIHAGPEARPDRDGAGETRPPERPAEAEPRSEAVEMPAPAKRPRRLSLLDFAPDSAASREAMATGPASSVEQTLPPDEANDDRTAAAMNGPPGTEDFAAGAAQDSSREADSSGEDEVAASDEPDVAETPVVREADAAAAGAAESFVLPAEDTPAFATADNDDGRSAKTARTDTSILERLPVPVLIHAGDSLYYANPEFLTLTGYADLAELEAAGGLGSLFVEALEDQERNSADPDLLVLTDRAGTEHPIQAVLRSVPWNGGNALMLVVRRDEEQAEQAAETRLAEREAELKSRISELRTIIDTATDGVVLIGTDGRIRSISRPAEAMFGLEADDVVDRPFSSLFAPESQRSADDYLNGLVDHGVASVLNDGREVIGREAQGRFIPIFMTIGRLPAGNGFCAVLRDITQWKRAEEELTQARAQAEHASSLKTDFLARVSHEIRTPLNAIIGFSELMVDERFGPIGNDRYRDYLRDINRSGSLVLELVNDLLDISKIEAGQQEMNYEAVSLNDTLGETVALMQPQANRERVIIRSSFASRLPDVVADLRSLRQIALNILSNAIRYTPAGGQVIVSTAYESNGEIVVRVRDTGVGMTPSEIEQALKPFKQINALKRTRGDGTGLGLPLTKAMVEANRARFSIASTPGEGTLVEVVFPTTRVLAS